MTITSGSSSKSLSLYVLTISLFLVPHANAKRGHQGGCRPASIDTNSVIADLVDRQEAGGAIPADPNSAVGPEQIITAVNFAVAINDKKTGERLSLTPTTDFWRIVPPSVDSFFSDPVVLFDEFTNRFFASILELVGFFADAELVIESPDSIDGVYPASKGSGTGSQGNFDLSGYKIVPAVPLNADTPLENSDEIAGNIALIASDNFITSSATKGNHAADAGAVGAIIYNSETNTVIRIFGSDFIPTISVGKEIGEAMLANVETPGVIGGMRTIPATQVGANSYSRMHLAVSHTATPKTAADFSNYIVGNADGPYKHLLADYPKLGIDDVALYISSNSWEFPVREDDTQNFFTQIVGINKSHLVANAGGEVPALFTNKLLVNPNDNEEKVFNAQNTLRLPTFLRPSKTAIPQVTFFVNPKLDNVTDGPEDGDTLIVTAMSNVLSGDPDVQTFEVPVAPWQAVSAGFPPNFEVFNVGAPQPPGIFQEFGDPLYRVDPVLMVMMYRCVQFNDSLWCAHTVGGPDIYEIRWYELDVSKIFDLVEPQVTLKQQGRIAPGVTTSAFCPSIDVDKDGNMGIGFCISGPEQVLSIAHTGRLSTDPEGTVRVPLQVNFQAQPEFPYYDSSQDFPPPGEPFEDYTLTSRWNDYLSCVLDPSDHKTFWVTSQYSNLDPVEYLVTFDPNWKTGTVNFCVKDEKGKTRTKPSKVGECPHSPLPALSEKVVELAAEKELQKRQAQQSLAKRWRAIIK